MKPTFSYIHPDVSMLYHYTTIDSLALILKHRTLRFSPLDRMDDLQEAQSAEVQNYGQFVFISSWTDQDEESIPMWKMYASMESGVRIALPPDPFQIMGFSGGVFRDPTDDEWSSAQTTHTGFHPVVDVLSMVNHNLTIPNVELGTQLLKVIYTDDAAKLKPKLVEFNDGTMKIITGNMGLYKSIRWDFQREYRYRLFILPVDMNPTHAVESIQELILTLQRGTANCPYNHFDLHLANNRINSMQIVTSPSMSEAKKIIVNSLVKEYCPTAKVVPSALEGLVR